jgi:hypothetical protein
MNIMEIGPLEYRVIGVHNQQLTRELFSELNTIQKTGMIRVVDLILVTKSVDGSMVMQEVNELSEEESAIYAGVIDQRNRVSI